VFGWRPERFGEGGALVLARLPGYVGGEPQQPVPRDVVAVLSSLDDATVSGSTPHWGIDFWVSDADVAASRAIEHGGRVVKPPTDEPGFRTAVLADAAGAVFSVSKLTMVD
jgi:hypothetical protein